MSALISPWCTGYPATEQWHVPLQEFVAFANDMVHSGPDAFFARVGRAAVVRTAIIPGAAHLIQQVPTRLMLHVIAILRVCGGVGVMCMCAWYRSARALGRWGLWQTPHCMCLPPPLALSAELSEDLFRE